MVNESKKDIFHSTSSERFRVRCMTCMEHEEEESCDRGRQYQWRGAIYHMTQRDPYMAVCSSLRGSVGSSWWVWCSDSPSLASRRTLPRFITSSIALIPPI